MSLDPIVTQLKQKMTYAPSINATVKVDLKDDGVIFIDGKQTPPVITHDDNDDNDADLVLICNRTVFEGILTGTQDPNIAFMMGKLKVKGSMGLAMKINSLLED